MAGLLAHPAPRTMLGGSLSPRLAELVLFIILLYAFDIFTPSIESSDNQAHDLALEMAQSNVYNQLFWISCAAVLGLAILRQPGRTLRIALQQAPLLILLVYVMFSTIWAVAPGISLRRAILSLIFVFCMLAAAAFVRSPRRMVMILYTALACMLAQSAVALGMGQSFDDNGLFVGYQGNKNTMGSMAAIAFLVGLVMHRYFESGWMRALNIVYLAAAVGFMLIAWSKTAVQLSVIVPLTLLLVFAFSQTFKLTMGLSLLIISTMIAAVLSLMIAGLGVASTEILAVVTEDTTFTKRTDIWAFVWEKAQERWLLGYGHQSFWSVGLDSVNLTARETFVRSMQQAHNGYLDLYAMLGLIGVILTVPILWRFGSATNAIRYTHPRAHVVAWTLLLYALLHNFLESSILRGYTGSWLIMVFALVLAERARYDLGAAERHSIRMPAQ